MDWKIPGEQAEDRLAELQEYLQNFPETKLAAAMREEIDFLEGVLGYA